MKIAISAESTLDLSKDLLEKYDISVLPFTVILGEKAERDGTLLPEEIFNYVEANDQLPKTTAINEYEYEEYFSGLREKYDAIIHFTLSGELSSTSSHAFAAAKKLNQVYVVDSRSLSTGIALLCIYARELADKGLSPFEISSKCLARVKNVQASFVLNTLEYLYRGGRCSALASFGANLLRLKPQIIVSNGKMIKGQVFRGKNEIVVASYCEDTLEKFNNPDLTRAFLTHSGASPDMIAAARSALEKAGFKEIIETKAGSTICSHCGPKWLGILYINDGGKNA